MRGFFAIALAGLLAVAGPSSAQMTLTGAGGTRHVASASLACSYTPVTTGTQGTAYTGATPSASGGTPAYTFSETGTLPGGLSISSSTGVISGTPTANGSFPTIQVKVTDSTSTVANCGASFTLVISPAAGPSPTFIGEVAATGVGGTMTAAAVPIGTASATRRVIVAVSYDSGSSPSVVSSATIGGVSAIVHAAADDTIQSNSGVAIFSAIVPTGTTATIIANGPTVTGIFAVYTVDNSTLTSGTPTTGSSVYAGTNLTTMTTSLTASAGGFVITSWNNNGGDRRPYTTTGATQDFDSANTSVFSQTGLSSGTITPTITITGGGVSWAMASASWR